MNNNTEHKYREVRGQRFPTNIRLQIIQARMEYERMYRSLLYLSYLLEKHIGAAFNSKHNITRHWHI